MLSTDMRAGFICPVCHKPLLQDEKTFRCENNHSYDISNSGYINLLMSQKAKDKNHGDDKLMVRARRNFLDKGYYRPMLDVLSETIRNYSTNGTVILDAGCGECFYTSNINDFLCRSGIKADTYAIDISKNALSLAKKRSHDIKRAVASIFDIPVADGSVDILLNIFAPFCREEFLRVLKADGIFIQVIPLENHLWTIKKIVYDAPYKNIIDEYKIDGFVFSESKEVKTEIMLESNQDIKNLFMMTPYYYKTSEKDFSKLNDISSLKTETEFAILVYKRK